MVISEEDELYLITVPDKSPLWTQLCHQVDRRSIGQFEWSIWNVWTKQLSESVDHIERLEIAIMIHN